MTSQIEAQFNEVARKWNFAPAFSNQMMAVIRAAVAEEREGCAQLMDRQAAGFQVLIDHAPTPIRAEDLQRVKHSCEVCAAQIRARSDRKENKEK